MVLWVVLYGIKNEVGTRLPAYRWLVVLGMMTEQARMSKLLTML